MLSGYITANRVVTQCFFYNGLLLGEILAKPNKVSGLVFVSLMFL